MPTLYQALVFVHVMMAVIWVGASFTLQGLAIRARRSPDPGETARVFGQLEWVGTRIIMPSSAILLVAGVWAVHEGPWAFSEGWISAGFAIWFLSFVAGGAFMGPESGRVRRLVAEHGAGDERVTARIGRLLAVTRIELVLLVAIIYIMSVKPF